MKPIALPLGSRGWRIVWSWARSTSTAIRVSMFVASISWPTAASVNLAAIVTFSDLDSTAPS